MRFYCRRLGYTTNTDGSRVRRVCSNCKYWFECEIRKVRYKSGEMK